MNDYPTWTSPSTATYCVAARCRDKSDEPDEHPRLAVAGTDLCTWHHARFPKILTDLASLYQPLSEAIVRPRRGDTNDRVQTSGVKDVSGLWNPFATQVRYELADWVLFTARTVLRDRPLPEPEVQTYTVTHVEYDLAGNQVIEQEQRARVREYTHGLTLSEPVPVILAGLAKHHCRWLSGYPDLGASLLADALEHRQQVMLAIDAPGVRRVGIRGHHCKDVIELDEELGVSIECSSQLVGILDDTGRPARIVCSRNPAHTEISRSEWMNHAHAG